MSISLKRFLSTLIDHAILFALIALVIILFGDKKLDDSYHANSFCWKIICGILLFYFPICHYFFRGTLGKKILSTKIIFNEVVDSNRVKILLLVFVRNIIAIFENGLTFYILPIILLALRGSRLSDILSKTSITEKEI